jgi:uncharacterized protein YbjT (DUF2867 family)
MSRYRSSAADVDSRLDRFRRLLLYAFAMAKEIVFVTGGTGNIGAAFVAILASHASAPTVRVASRDPKSAGARLVRAFNPETIHPTPFDVNDPSSMRAALEGVTKLFVIAPFSNDLPAWHEKVGAAAKGTPSLEYIVKVSVTGAAGPDAVPPPGRIPLQHWQGEEALRKTGIASTMIRPTMFMQHFLSVPGLYTRGADRFFLPIGDARVAWLDCRDIAAAAAALVLASPEVRAPFLNTSFELTGPHAHSAAELAEVLTLVGRRPIEHVGSGEAFTARCKEVGAPDVLRVVYEDAAGGCSRRSKTPRSFDFSAVTRPPLRNSRPITRSSSAVAAATNHSTVAVAVALRQAVSMSSRSTWTSVAFAAASLIAVA